MIGESAAPAPPAAPVSADIARLAGALLQHARAAYAVVPAEERGPSLGAIDAFLVAPTPGRFLSAVRHLREAQRAAVLAAAAHNTVGRLFADGISALRAVPGVPPDVIDHLASDLPPDARSSRRLAALAALLGSYEELLGRVVADHEEMRRRLRPRRGFARPETPPPPRRRKR